MNALIPRNSVETIVQFRDAAIRKYEEAFEVIATADAILKEAAGLWRAAAPGASQHYYDDSRETKAFASAVQMPDRDLYLRTARRLIDLDVWSHVIETTEIASLMDKEAKDKLRDQMRYVPERTNEKGAVINMDEIERGLPPVTVENIVATLERFQADAEFIFRRGVANAFSGLDRRFRSHDGFKIGSRVILNHAFDENGRWCWGYRSQQDTLLDIERAFQILDGKSPKASYAGIVGTVDRERQVTWDPHQSEHQGDYFKIRIFKNGNAHLWFTRDDLVEKVNKILADWYGEVIGDGQSEEADPLAEVKTTLARYFGFFPTPEAAAGELLSGTPLLRSVDKPPLRVLDPSAGTGNLARRCFHRLEDFPEWQRERYGREYRYDNKVDCIEIQPHLAMQLEAEGIYNRVICGDFLQMRPDLTDLYDVVLMNPPFDRERDIDHVVHALEFLKSDGYLAAIMSAGTEFRETRKAIAFREMMEKMNAKWSDLPAGSFAEAGTYVNTCIVRVYKDGRKRY